eukprot:TRINITY_DN3217_c0_g1_i1.p1 TRINITY_DN3217_c0_g1~~TRINITY_DN3217_c0_g1_i1.p1  ORF type:complete len:372 (-),score=31.60 TRINITY_DN3217_c0_g1_i1:570-1685(-)
MPPRRSTLTTMAIRLTDFVISQALLVWWCMIGFYVHCLEWDVRVRLSNWWNRRKHYEEIKAERSLSAVNGKKVGKTCIITGANSGVGLETARHIAATGYKVILACRSKARAEEAIKDIVQSNKSKNLPCDVIFMQLDLADQENIRKFVDDVVSKNYEIDLLINNAGLMWLPRQFTKEGIEMHFGVNHIGHFLLTNLMIPHMNKRSRILVLVSDTYRYGIIPFEDLTSSKYYSKFYAYCNSKLATMHFAFQLAENLKNSHPDMIVLAVNPGTSRTGIIGELPRVIQLLYAMLGPLFRTPYQAACCTIYCALSEEMVGKSGSYLFQCKFEEPIKNCSVNDKEERVKLWKISDALTDPKQREMVRAAQQNKQKK